MADRNNGAGHNTWASGGVQSPIACTVAANGWRMPHGSSPVIWDGVNRAAFRHDEMFPRNHPPPGMRHPPIPRPWHSGPKGDGGVSKGSEACVCSIRPVARYHPLAKQGRPPHPLDTPCPAPAGAHCCSLPPTRARHPRSPPPNGENGGNGGNGKMGGGGIGGI